MKEAKSIKDDGNAGFLSFFYNRTVGTTSALFATPIDTMVIDGLRASRLHHCLTLHMSLGGAGSCWLVLYGGWARCVGLG